MHVAMFSRAFNLTLSTLLAMAKKRPWEPLLIIVAIMLANAGLITVLLINEGASQGALLQSQSSMLSGDIVRPKNENQGFTKNDYALLRRAGFTSLIALTERDVDVACESAPAKTKRITQLGIDFQPFMGSAFANAAALDSAAQTAPENTVALVNPITAASLSCANNVVIDSDNASRKETFSQSINKNVIEDTLVVSIDSFYSAGVTVERYPITGFIALQPMNSKHLLAIQELIDKPVALQRTSENNETGSLPDSFKLNLWAMSALMGVVALFIVLNAINLMYRTRLPSIIRLRQLGIGKLTLLLALYAELLFYCFVAIPLGMAIGFYAASSLSPIISGTFSSLFNAVFINPDVNLLTLFALTLSITFISLSLFAVVPVKELAHALSSQTVRKTNTPSGKKAVGYTVLTAFLLFIFHQLVNSTAFALLFVAVLLLLCCYLVLLWLPLFAKALCLITPKRWPVFHFVTANMHLLSGKTKLAVCAFFIALTANIGMNTMTDSFRSATEQWLDQRLYAPFYFYTEQPLSTISLPSDVVTTPLLRAQGAVLHNGQSIERVSLSSYPVHAAGKEALVLDSSAPNSWQQFTQGEGIYINQQLAFTLNIGIGETLQVSDIRVHNKNNTSKAPVTTNAKSNIDGAIFKSPVKWKVLGIYPDYGNLNGQLLIPLTHFNLQNDTTLNALFAGVMAIYPPAQYREGSNPIRLTKNQLQKVLQVSQTDNNGQLFSQAELMGLSLNTFDKTFVLTDGLNITTLLVAGVAFAVSLTVLSLGNAAQLSVLRALGVSELKVKVVLFFQYLLLCLITALLSVPCGIYLAYVFINLVNRYAFHWSYSLDVNPVVIATSIGVSLLIISLVLLLPLGKLKPKVDLRQDTQL